ncbi:hypothetical protein Syun_008916 [Stephania yunnanensis]|uniref:Plant bHLH transcription factor ACT-like domain-containing protein n=1 Tax=Stephania yunnanensis TaxID=152371 RepID=A0AAP0PNK1_9MAGN
MRLLHGVHCFIQVRKSSIIMDAFNYIKQLKLMIEAMKKQYANLTSKVPKEVKVEKIENGFLVRVTSEKGRDMLVSVLEVFEEMGLNVVQARVSCTHSFCMEAIIETDQVVTLEVREVTQAISKALEKKIGVRAASFDTM